MNRLAALSASLTLCIAAATLTSPAAFSAEENLLDGPDKQWRRGPVQYILTRDEDKQFKKLKTAEERKAFIAEFWARRDPTPDTEANEFKDQFAGRLEMVTERFAPPAGRGWNDDRGKVVLLLGAPNTVQMTEPSGGGGNSVPTGVGAPGGTPGAGAPAGGAARARALFVYEQELFEGGPTPAELEFIGEGNGGFRLLTRFDETDAHLNGLEPLPHLIPVAVEEPVVVAEEPAAPPPPAPPTDQELLIAEVLSETPPEPGMDLVTRMDFYKTEAEETLLTLTVAVDQPGESPLIAARLLDENLELGASLEKEDSFNPAEGEMAGAGGTHSLFQGAHNVTPGKYSVVTAVKDPASGKVGYDRREIEVPDFNQGVLQMSTLTLARKVEKVSEPAGSGSRFIIGNLKVVPAPTPVFRAGQEVAIYYQVYNAANDDTSGKPKLKLSYTFAKLQGSRKIILGGKPIVQEGDGSVHAFWLPIAPVYPAGDYEVEVKVDDLVAGTTTTTVAPFKVEKEG